MIERLPRPCVATLGNHDHWAGAAAIRRSLEGQGVVVLQNHHESISLRGSRRLVVVGVDDGFTKHHDVARALAGVHRPEQALVLTHDPDTADAIVQGGARLVLAGHTHGGQVHIPRVTRALSRMVGNRYLAGWYKVGRGRLYVNVGIGSSFIRWRAGRRTVPEVAVMDLS
jgi:predicted MPP superfamily phosphohydrolase